MTPFTTLTGRVCPMNRSHVDTDQIIPKQFLKRIERTGFGQYLFYDWRFDEAERELPGFELNRPEYRDAKILLARQNFGCGSSREHAVWALADYGIRAVIASGFADIFYNNCFKNGVLPVPLAEAEVERLFQLAGDDREFVLTIDLPSQTVAAGNDLTVGFEVDPFRKHCLLHGLDDIGLTLLHEARISAFETPGTRA